ncbi:MAG: DUF2384 domain-containing protein [Pseudomonadota bacterium]|nr:DUF2384 domain-containing protein [Pseudomonadota bacterium]
MTVLIAREPRPASAGGWPDPVDASAGLRDLALLGGQRLLRRSPESRADVHAALDDGMPYAALFHLIEHNLHLSEADVAEVIGLSTRTLHRQRSTPKARMATDLGSRTWLLAEALAAAVEVMGSRGVAERWMTEPAMGLDGARPIDLLRTSQGAELVTDFLGRLEFGVYN